MDNSRNLFCEKDCGIHLFGPRKNEEIMKELEIP
jgi:hypothetical protein